MSHGATSVLWEQAYSPGVKWNWTPPQPQPVERFLEEAADRWPERVAIDFYGHTVSYRELWQLAARVACGLQRLGLEPGDMIALYLPNTPHFVGCFFGALLAGGRIVNVSSLAGAYEVERQLSSTGVSIVIASDLELQSASLRSLDRTGVRSLVICSLIDFVSQETAREIGATSVRTAPASPRGMTCLSFASLIANDGIWRTVPRGDPQQEVALLQFTGGTTGSPKAAMLSHANLNMAVSVNSYWEGDVCAGDSRCTLAVLPFSHIIGLSVIMLRTLAVGRTIVLHLRFDPRKVVTDIRTKHISAFAGVPAMYAALVSQPDITKADLRSLRICSVGGAPLSLELAARFQQLTGVAPREGYAMTETTCVATWQPLHSLPRVGTVGVPMPGVCLEIVDLDTGMWPLPPGQRGQIRIRGPQVMLGYWKEPEETRAVLRDGWLYTGDVGTMDAEGYVFVHDRLKDMIICGGYKVFPRRIELLLHAHPAVAEACIIGVADDELGQVPKAFVVPRECPGPLTVSELYAHLKPRLAKYEIPVEITLCSQLPRTPYGKISKQALAASPAQR